MAGRVPDQGGPARHHVPDRAAQKAAALSQEHLQPTYLGSSSRCPGDPRRAQAHERSHQRSRSTRPGLATRRAAADLRVPSAARSDERGCATQILVDAGAPGLSPAGHRADLRELLDFYETGAAERERSRAASRWRCSASSSAPIPVPHRARSGAAWPQERSSRSATWSWPPGCRSSSGAASRTTSCWIRRAQGQLQESGGARAAGAADAGRPAVDGARDELRGSVALPAQSRRTSAPERVVFPDFDDNLRQAFRRETELFFESIVREDRTCSTC